MNPIKARTTLAAALALMATFGCASTRTHEAAGQYVDDSVITAKVKAAVVGEPGLKVSEINVETFKGVVQLSGFVSSREDIKSAIRVASAVDGVKTVKNDMRLKDMQVK
jgi:osmotically-inducible protein OsmY